jgi:hypothetical protein
MKCATCDTTYSADYDACPKCAKERSDQLDTIRARMTSLLIVAAVGFVALAILR